MTNKIKPLPQGQTMKWAGGAMAAAAAATTANAGLVQINLIGNQITASGGDQLFADFNGGGDDVTIANQRANSNYLSTYTSSGNNYTYAFNGAAAKIDGQFNWGTSYGYGNKLGPASFFGSPVSQEQSNLFAITLDGSPAWLQIDRQADGRGNGQVVGPGVGDPNAGIYLSRVIYNEGGSMDTPDKGTSYTVVGSADASGFTPVPEPSGLALLALGAGGLLTRRRRAA